MHAERLNRRLVYACVGAQTQAGPLRPGQLHVAIVGGGATGTELAAELTHATRELVAYGLDHIDPQRDIRIVLIEGAERILPGLPERISKATHQLLDQMAASLRPSVVTPVTLVLVWTSTPVLTVGGKEMEVIAGHAEGARETG